MCFFHVCMYFYLIKFVTFCFSFFSFSCCCYRFFLVNKDFHSCIHLCLAAISRHRACRYVRYRSLSLVVVIMAPERVTKASILCNYVTQRHAISPVTVSYRSLSVRCAIYTTEIVPRFLRHVENSQQLGLKDLLNTSIVAKRHRQDRETDRTGQWSDSIGRTVLQTVAQKR